MHEYAVYAGSFDPPTKGHVWMIEQASAMFDKLIVAVARNPEKTYTFDVKLREAWLNQVAERFSNVEVATLENEFLSHYAQARGARFIVRGIRNEDDYQYERAMRYVNADLAPGLTTVFLIPPRELCEVSSSFVKGMVGPVGWEPIVEGYVPGPVYAHLREWANSPHTRPEAAEGAVGDGS
ncbi:MAG: pantetheine-phosphate adenylyltransferase [Planctomycetota bacterium]